MRAHGAQKRASGDPYFSHPLEVAAILTDLGLDDATIVAAVCTTRSRTRSHAGRKSTACSAPTSAASSTADQDQAARSRFQARRAGRELPQAAARHRRRCARAAGEARRPAAQHAHAAFRAGRQSARASPRKHSTSMRRSRGVAGSPPDRVGGVVGGQILRGRSGREGPDGRQLAGLTRRCHRLRTGVDGNRQKRLRCLPRNGQRRRRRHQAPIRIRRHGRDGCLALAERRGHARRIDGGH